MPFCLFGSSIALSPQPRTLSTIFLPISRQLVRRRRGMLMRFDGFRERYL
uniref:Uncharacterized protein n=1 Tax=Romanomermis culicivorax TaxID=13658 RepID=A0A915ISD0_ROMCU